MTAAHDYEAIHHLVDRLSPSQVRRLRLLVTEPEQIETEDAELRQAVRKVVRELGMAQDAAQSPDSFAPRRRSLSFVGTLDAEPDLGEKSASLVRDGLGGIEC